MFRGPYPPSPPDSEARTPPKDVDTIEPNDQALTDTPIQSPFSSSWTSSSDTTDSVLGPNSGGREHRPFSGSETPSGLFYGSKSVGRCPRWVRLEEFELIRVLGKGCAGRVLLTRHCPTSSIRAIKAISKRSVLTHDELTHTLTELAILRRFAEHEPRNPFIAALHHAFTDKENFYFVMDFYPGGDMATQMEIHGILGHHRTRFYAADIVQGLEDLHRHGIIVRDLKPENILLNARGHAVLADFGLSKEFPYRGEPRPLHVVTYPGQGDLPEWAGQGAGSMRTLSDGSRKLVVDRAYSFVGTSEYLSPEVVKRGEYSYAVDWWAVGCIVLEGMIGRVPFRKDEAEPPIVLWNKILSDPWDDIFKDPKLAGRLPIDYGLDPTTWDFIDALLIKDPLWRLTEPFVKRHTYFQYIDWETVKRGEYEDPHDLSLHPIQEFNTRYFPKLCLEEVPTVDMTSHDMRFADDAHRQKPTPLNDNALYALEQAKYRAELEAFTWSRQQGKVEMPVHEVENEADEIGDQLEAGIFRKSGFGQIPEPDIQPGVTAPTPESIGDEVSVEAETIPTPAEDGIGSVNELSSFARAPDWQENTRPPSLSLADLDDPSTPTLLEEIPGRLTRSTSTQEPVPIPSPTPRTAPRRGTSYDHRLPNGLPSSGLSVSDMISIPSPGLGSPTRIIRRHPRLPSVDTIPIARLSVELNGTVSQLGDEDWEELNLEGIESMPNGSQPPNSFFSRVLKRRPSTIQTSGLRRQARSSDSSRDSVSPSKRAPPLPFLASKGKEQTKKALERIKAFPMIRKVSPNAEGNRITPFTMSESDPQVSRVVPDINGHLTPSKSAGNIMSANTNTITPAPRPDNGRRHTESGLGWFEKKPRIGKQVSVTLKKDKREKEEGQTRSYSAKNLIRPRHEGVESEGRLRTSERSIPRVELTETPPIVWELDRRD